MTEALEPAWLLHRREYGDGGFLADFMGLRSGRFSAVVRGARRKARGGSHVGVLRPFLPLLVAQAGRGELKTLRRIEASQAAIELTGERVFSGLYLNELLVRLLPRFEPLPRLFAEYGETLACLEGNEDVERGLRYFELTLLTELGYGIRFDMDADNDAVEASHHYRYDPERGFLPCVFAPETGHDPEVLQGEQLLNIADWLFGGDGLAAGNSRIIKFVTRRALQQQLGERTLNSRELLMAFRNGAETGDLSDGVK